MKITAILAAGEARRLPNKVLLPVKPDMKPCFIAALEYAWASNPDLCILIVNPSNAPLLKCICDYYYHATRPRIIIQPSPCGVIDAMQRVLPLMDDPEDKLLTLFGDNVYEDQKVFDHWDIAVPMGCVRQIEGNQLDGHNGTVWQQREEEPRHKLAGWLYVKAKHLNADWGDTGLMNFLNDINARPHLTKQPGWADIGTLDSYTRHMT